MQQLSWKGKRVVKNVTVTVPAGIDNNMNLRMTGYGEGGSNGGENDDYI